MFGVKLSSATRERLTAKKGVGHDYIEVDILDVWRQSFPQPSEDRGRGLRRAATHDNKRIHFRPRPTSNFPTTTRRIFCEARAPTTSTHRIFWDATAPTTSNRRIFCEATAPSTSTHSIFWDARAPSSRCAY